MNPALPMTRTVIPVPRSLDLPSALSFSIALARLEQADEFVFDFANTQHVEPFPMLLVSSEIQRLVTRFEGTKMACTNFKHMTYPGHMGFFQAFGLEFGNAPGGASGSKRYIPLKIFHCDQIIQSAAEKGIEVGDEVEGESQQMAAMLCGSDIGPIYDTLTYSVREMVRNVVEHSKAKRSNSVFAHSTGLQKIRLKWQFLIEESVCARVFRTILI